MRWSVLVALLLIPTVTAEGSGSFLAEEGASLPAGTEVRFTPALAFTDHPSRLLDFRLDAPHVRLYEFSRDRYAAAGSTLATTSPPPARVRELTNVTISLDRTSEEGFIGFYPSPDARGLFTALMELQVEGRSRGRVDTATGESDFTQPDATPMTHTEEYERTVRTPALWMEGVGRLAYEGAGHLKVYGPDLLVSSDQGFDRLETGVPNRSALQATYRWVVLTLEDATVRVDSRSPWILAAPAASVRWEGVATLSASTGSFDAPEGRYEALRDDARLRGRFQAALAPEAVHGQVGTRLVLSGDVEETTLPLSAAAAQAWFPPESPRFAHLVVGVMVGLGASVGTGAYLASRRRPRAPALPLTVEDCMAAATKAADEEDWERAIQWLRRVRDMAPTSVRTCADLAHALCQTGRKDEALHTYEEASRLAHDGEADFNGAVVAAEAGRPPHEVESWLERALDRTPMYVVDVDSDPVFQALRGRARFERIVADAWTRMDDVDDDALVR